MVEVAQNRILAVGAVASPKMVCIRTNLNLNLYLALEGKHEEIPFEAGNMHSRVGKVIEAPIGCGVRSTVWSNMLICTQYGSAYIGRTIESSQCGILVFCERMQGLEIGISSFL